MAARVETWCERDEHNLFEYFIDFNEWLDSGDEEGAKIIREVNGIDGLAQPSKAFYAGDREAYEQAFKKYRIQRRHEVLGKESFESSFGDDHWYERNEERFNQLVECLINQAVVPFIGAGVSVSGGFPTWKDHLRQQGRTAGLDSDHVDYLLSNGQYEAVIEEIENTRGRDVFVQEIRDVFSKTGDLQDIHLRIAELFNDTIITTNYDRLLEHCFDIGPGSEFEVINSFEAMHEPEVGKTTIIKLHGDILSPQRCILSKNQYDQAYGLAGLDLHRPIPKLLSFHYQTSSLLFIGCSLNNDRTIQVFEAVKQEIGDRDRPQHFSIEQAPETEDELVARNTQLANLGITAIWYQKGQYDLVESILRHARNEVKYQVGDLSNGKESDSKVHNKANNRRAENGIKTIARSIKNFLAS